MPDDLKKELADIIYSKVEQILDLLPKKPKAIIWGGGFPRGEATYIQGKLLNDLDLFVFDSFNPFLLRLKMLEGWEKINQDKVKVSISIGTPKHLVTDKTITNYELRTGKVIYGDKKIKQRIKANSNNLSRFEGLRKLFTRLSALQNLDRTDLELSHLAAKTYIACADSYLLLDGKYAPSYRKRMKRIQEVEMPEKLRKKAQKAYAFKISKGKEFNFSIEEAKKELLCSIKNYLDSYIRQGKQPIQKLKVLDKKIPPNILLNLYFYQQLKKKFTPKFFKVVFCFNIVKLYLALLYYEQERWQEVEKILGNFIKEKGVSNLPEVIPLAPNPSSVELF